MDKLASVMSLPNLLHDIAASAAILFGKEACRVGGGGGP